tara:strand:+ start:1441 stop:1941 length:501 start_codon:yes stop_codon:yes gene_type:complete
MTKITVKGNPINTSGKLPNIGSLAKDFKLIATDLSTKTLEDYKGQKIVLNIFPSIDTETCAVSVRKFNQFAADLKNTLVLCVSKDLPFAQNRFCGAEGIKNVHMLSDFKTGQFGLDYGLNIIDNPLEGLLSRCIVVINAKGAIAYTEQINEITEEPNYNLALEKLL